MPGCAGDPDDRTLTAAIHQEEDWFVARCLELDVASQGESLEVALATLREAVELYLDQVSQPQIEATPFVTAFQICQTDRPGREAA
jgi:predicted RNase H-like HicB family nuclease